MLFFRGCSASSIDQVNRLHIEQFMETYLERFREYESWPPENRLLVFYEDFITQINGEATVKLLDFIGEEPTFYYDYIQHKEEYQTRILNSYKNQHNKNKKNSLSGGSSVGGAKEIYYTQDKPPRVLIYIDELLKKKEPKIWEKYLKRFKTRD